MAEFVLIHGGMHGGWCWERLEPELARLGHTSVATTHKCDVAGLGNGDYAREVADQVGHLSDDVIVVGHSIGGLVAPLLPALRPVRGLVLLCAAVPAVGLGFAEQADTAPASAVDPERLIADEAGFIRYTAEAAPEVFCHDVDQATVDAILPRLRPQALSAMVEKTPMERWPDVPTHSIYCRDDRAMSPVYSRIVAQHRGFPLTEMEGSHSPFYSRPRDLARELDHIATEVLATAGGKS
ncbi:alpha/beta hydrolase [Pseudonocardia xishanensis]|uniref:Alpha/beta fold hydrolase n=1 Tax=Pseudonocardia xishanensis TaxID=630995 RepID=A0ABP8RZX8_9PSEU